MQKIKKLYWILCQEQQKIIVSFINWLPGRFGLFARGVYYKKRLAKCGCNVHIENKVTIQNFTTCEIGDNVFVGAGSYLNSSGKLTIDSDVHIGYGTKIWTDNHLYQDHLKPFTLQGFEYKPVHIENDVYIGAKCFIKPGLTIGSGAIIQDGTILAKSIPPFAIVQGNPGIIIGWRKEKR